MKSFPSTRLRDLQQHIQSLCQQRGWNRLSHVEKFLLLSEEVGELAAAIRNHLSLVSEIKQSQDPSPSISDSDSDSFDKSSLSSPSSTSLSFEALQNEFADVFNYLLDLANGFDIDLEKAFWKKDQINAKRQWTSLKNTNPIKKQP